MGTFSPPDCIRTYTGKDINIFFPEREMFCVEDVAWSLSKEQRFGNMLSRKYSVAQHSIICADLAPQEHKFTALMHDSPEFILRDFPTPIKKHAIFAEYRKLEDSLSRFMAEHFGFQYPLPECVVEIDAKMANHEWLALMLQSEKFNYIISMTQRETYKKFVSMYNKLKPKTK